MGVNASSTLILERLVCSDTATAFNITSRDVNVTGISQVGRRVLLVNVSATLGVDLPTNSSENDVEAELAVKNLSADEAIDLMAFHPDRFWVRTTKVRLQGLGFDPSLTDAFHPLKQHWTRDAKALALKYSVFHAHCLSQHVIMSNCDFAGTGCDG